jgi:hypothetical protein
MAGSLPLGWGAPKHQASQDFLVESLWIRLRCPPWRASAWTAPTKDVAQERKHGDAGGAKDYSSVGGGTRLEASL